VPVNDHLVFCGQRNRHRSEPKFAGPKRRLIHSQKIARNRRCDVQERLIAGSGQQGEATGGSVDVRGQVDVSEAVSGLSEERRGQFRASVGFEGSARLRLLIVERDGRFLQDVRGGGRQTCISNGRYTFPAARISSANTSSNSSAALSGSRNKISKTTTLAPACFR
jgi:hypothetical protein